MDDFVWILCVEDKSNVLCETQSCIKERKTATMEYSTEVILGKRDGYFLARERRTGREDTTGFMMIIYLPDVCLGSVLYIYTPVVCHTNLICLVSISPQNLLLSLWEKHYLPSDGTARHGLAGGYTGTLATPATSEHDASKELTYPCYSVAVRGSTAPLEPHLPLSPGHRSLSHEASMEGVTPGDRREGMGDAGIGDGRTV